VNTGYATIITPIVGEEASEALKHFLRTAVEPRFDRDEPREILKCQPRFPFDRIGSLHFCSFAVLDGDAEFPPSLVFEATFDGSLDHFLNALLEVAPGAVDEIYRHCEGYPVSGLASPELFKEYLARHDKGAHTFYFGSPGRTVAQIKGETQIYDAMANSVGRPWSRHKAMPATFAGILQELRDVILNEPGHRWAQQTPWEVTWRKAVPVAAVLAVLGAASLLGTLLAVSGFDPSVLIGDLGDHLIDYLKSIFPVRKAFDFFWFLPLLVFIAIWAGLRFFELVIRLLFKDPRRQSFWRRIFFHILIIMRYFIILEFVRFSIFGILYGFFPGEHWIPGPSTKIACSVGAGFVLLLFQHWATSLKLAVQFKELEPTQEIYRRLLVDTLRVGMVVVAVFALVVLTDHFDVDTGPPPYAADRSEDLGTGPPQPDAADRSEDVYTAPPLPDAADRFEFRFAPFAVTALKVLLAFTGFAAQVLATYAVPGLIFAYAIGCLLFVALRIMEWLEAKRFSSADGLAAFDNSAAYAREEGGINTYQNHLVSLTYVKPCLLRALSLRLTLFVVGLLSRFWYNAGTLGGIPTILSARWVLINGGRRLLFLDHYSGAWNNYLNEFIDMTAVFGLNAIWTNTFIKARGSQYGFPETEYYFWKGAQVERPFKAYVRHSQIETLVWYGAYPTVSTVNVNTNTEVRRSLFKPPVSCEIDSLLQNL
jgi:hypothetical protein